MSNNWDFEIPTKIQFGRGRLAQLGKIAAQFGKSAMLVGYANRTGLEKTYERAEKVLARAGIDVTKFYEVPPDPDAELGQEGARQAKAAGVDMVIGLGGGSAIDCGKGIAALVKMEGKLWEYAGSNPDGKLITDSLPVIAVPTTSGTGSEVTPVAVFTHHGVGSQEGIALKASINGPAVRPTVALVDPDLTIGAPPRLTAVCGADALAHAIEACMSTKANPMSMALATRAIVLLSKNLLQAVEDPNDPEPREALALGSMLAGTAFGNVGVVLPHAIGQALGSLLHIPHGEAVAIGTPPNLRYNAEVCQGLYRQLAHYCGTGGDTPEERADGFVNHIIELFKKLGLPDRVDPGEHDREELAEKLTINAYESTAVPIRLSPRPVDHETLKGMFLEILL